MKTYKQAKLSLVDKRHKWRTIAKKVCLKGDGVYSGNVFYWCEEKSGHSLSSDDKDWIVTELVKARFVFYNNRFFHPKSEVLKEAVRVTKLMKERGEIEE